MGLFETPSEENAGGQRPLADRMRPRSLAEFIGQEHLLSEGKPLRLQIDNDRLGSIILWGPPGSGKTTLARIVARMTHCEFVAFSGVMSSIKDVKAVMASAERLRRAGRRTIVFVDEIHRFNKAQQDAFLPHVESGDITLIGATTENPSFEVIAALLSRAKVYVLRPLEVGELTRLLQAALDDSERGLGGRGVDVPPAILERIALFSGGDARAALRTLETVAGAASGGTVTESLLEDAMQRKLPRYDKSGEEHFNLISALHKSIRSSDPDAALYWLARMLEGGEDRLYIGRRLARMAAEDIGLADPRALEQAMAAVEAFRFTGEPEGDLYLAQAAVYLAIAPKSDAVYRALGAARDDARRTADAETPLHLRNAPTKLMRELGYGEGYEHAHDRPDALPGMDCLPERLQGKRYYFPSGRGVEERIAKRLEDILKRRSDLQKNAGKPQKIQGS